MFGTYCRLHVHVWAPDCEVIRQARKKLSKAGRARNARDARRRFYKEMLRIHHNEQATCIRFAL